MSHGDGGKKGKAPPLREEPVTGQACEAGEREGEQQETREVNPATEIMPSYAILLFI